MREGSFTDLSAHGQGLSKWRSFMQISFLSEHPQEDLDNLPAVTKRVYEKVDTAVDGEEKVANKEQLRADGNFLQWKRLVSNSYWHGV